jgi:hypothetical protein
MKLSGPITKRNDDEQLAFGWLYLITDADGVDQHDASKVVFKAEDLEPAVYAYVLDSRDGGVMHLATRDSQGRPIAKLVESMWFDKAKWEALGIDSDIVGWWVGYKVFDDDVWKAIAKGDLSMFSAGGTGDQVPL